MRQCLVSSILALVMSINLHSCLYPTTLLLLAGLLCLLIYSLYHRIANGLVAVLLLSLSIALSVTYSGYWLEDQLASRLPIKLSGIKVSGIAKVVGCDYSTAEVGKLRFSIISLDSENKQVMRLEKIVVNHYLLSRKQSHRAAEAESPDLKPRIACNVIISFSAKLRAPYSFINPYGFDYEAWQLSRGTDASGYLLDYQVLSIDRSLSSWLNSLRQQGIARAAALPGRVGQITPALLFGESGYLNKDAWLDLQMTGTVHLLIVSGLHVSFLILLVMLLWRQLIRLEVLLFSPSFSYLMRLTPIVLLLACLLYSYMAGMGLAVQRSGLMLMVAILISFSRRHWSLFDTWLWVMWMVLIINPMASLFVGFWFSFFAVGGLMLGNVGRIRSSSFSSVWGDKLNILYKPQWIIFLTLLPLLWLYQQPSSLFSLLVNIIAIPLLAFIILPLAILGFVSTNSYLLVLFDGLLEYLLASLHQLSLLSSWLVFKPSGLWIFLLVPFVGVALFIKGFPFKSVSLFLLVGIFFLPTQVNDDKLLVFDVGQGLSIYGRLSPSVEGEGETTWLYDTGAKFRSGFSLGRAVVAKNMLAFTGNELDLLFISHSDNDHAGGEEGLLQKIKVKQTVAGQPSKASHENCHDLTNSWQSTKGLRWRVFNVTNLGVARVRDNDMSCVVQIEMSGQRILMPGDIEKKTERKLVEQFGKALRSDIMLVAHHGSKTSSTESFIRAVSPKLAIISSGMNNPYPHPHQAVVERFNRLSIPLYNTALSGAIEIKLTKKLTVIEWRKKKPPIWRQL